MNKRKPQWRYLHHTWILAQHYNGKTHIRASVTRGADGWEWRVYRGYSIIMKGTASTWGEAIYRAQR